MLLGRRKAIKRNYDGEDEEDTVAAKQRVEESDSTSSLNDSDIQPPSLVCSVMF